MKVRGSVNLLVLISFSGIYFSVWYINYMLFFCTELLFLNKMQRETFHLIFLINYLIKNVYMWKVKFN